MRQMRSTLAGPAALARFSAERQALARLSHPNVAAMYDAGATEEGFPVLRHGARGGTAAAALLR
ncbi:MAG TPA: hypothetical protein VF713_19755 [Thermoanaerobaculia bacterium]